MKKKSIQITENEETLIKNALKFLTMSRRPAEEKADALALLLKLNQLELF